MMGRTDDGILKREPRGVIKRHVCADTSLWDQMISGRVGSVAPGLAWHGRFQVSGSFSTHAGHLLTREKEENRAQTAA